MTGSNARRSIDWRRSPLGFLFILPCAAVFAIFLAYPLLRNLYVSFFDWNGLTDSSKFVGWANFKWVVTDPSVLDTVRNTLVFAVLTIGVQMIGGFFLAVLLAGDGWLRRLVRTLFFIPVVLTPVVVGFLYSKILEPNDGELVNLLRTVGLSSLGHGWLGDPQTALIAVCVVNIWLWTGFSMSVYQAALAGLPRELVEAARIDGANTWQSIWHVIFPFLRPAHYALLTLSVIATLKTFDIVYVLTKGGPGGATELPTTLLFRVGFDQYRQGRAAALGTVLFVVALILTIVQLRAYGRGAEK